MTVDHLTAIDLQLAGLHQRTPYAIHGVMNTQLSIARHYGGIHYQGEGYTYIPESDELVRNDVIKHLKTAQKKTPSPQPQPTQTQQLDLLELKS
jgi:hypothetical protein